MLRFKIILVFAILAFTKKYSQQSFICNFEDRLKVEDSLLLKIQNKNEFLKKIKGKWIYDYTIDDKNRKIEYLTQKFDLGNNQIEWIDTTINDFCYIFDGENFTKIDYIETETEKFEQKSEKKLYFMKNFGYFKTYPNIEKEPNCNEIPQILLINSISDQELIIFEPVLFENKNNVKFVKYVLKKTK